MKQLFLDSHNYKLDVHVFEVDSPKAIVQVIHGMEEHQERYEPFVNFLISGSSNNSYEEFSKWDKTLNDSYGIRRFIKMEIKNVYERNGD